MGVFKNEVGRPSNETIKKRNILRLIIVFLIVLGIVLISMIIKNVGKSESQNNKILTTKKETTKNNKITTTEKNIKKEDEKESNNEENNNDKTTTIKNTKKENKTESSKSDNNQISSTRKNPGRIIGYESQVPMIVYVGGSTKKNLNFNSQDYKFSYSSSNPDIISVDSNGIIIGKKYSSSPVYIKAYEEYSGEIYTDTIYTILDPTFVGDSTFSIGKGHGMNCGNIYISFINPYTLKNYDDISPSDIYWNFTGSAVSNGMFTHFESGNKRSSHICVNENYLEHSEVSLFIKLGNYSAGGSAGSITKILELN